MDLNKSSPGSPGKDFNITAETLLKRFTNNTDLRVENSIYKFNIIVYKLKTMETKQQQTHDRTVTHRTATLFMDHKNPELVNSNNHDDFRVDRLIGFKELLKAKNKLSLDSSINTDSMLKKINYIEDSKGILTVSSSKLNAAEKKLIADTWSEFEWIGEIEYEEVEA